MFFHTTATTLLSPHTTRGMTVELRPPTHNIFDDGHINFWGHRYIHISESELNCHTHESYVCTQIEEREGKVTGVVRLWIHIFLVKSCF